LHSVDGTEKDTVIEVHDDREFIQSSARIAGHDAV